MFTPQWIQYGCPVLWTSATTVLGWCLLITAVISERYTGQNYTSTVPNALRETVLKIPYCFTLCKDVLPSFRWLNTARELILSMYNNMLFVSRTAGSWARLRLDHVPTTKKRGLFGTRTRPLSLKTIIAVVLVCTRDDCVHTSPNKLHKGGKVWFNRIKKMWKHPHLGICVSQSSFLVTSPTLRLLYISVVVTVLS